MYETNGLMPMNFSTAVDIVATAFMQRAGIGYRLTNDDRALILANAATLIGNSDMLAEAPPHKELTDEEIKAIQAEEHQRELEYKKERQARRTAEINSVVELLKTQVVPLLQEVTKQQTRGRILAAIVGSGMAGEVNEMIALADEYTNALYVSVDPGAGKPDPIVIPNSGVKKNRKK